MLDILENQALHFEQISLLITVYNRSDSLIRLLKSFQELNISFHEIVVSDDASEANHFEKIDRLKEEYHFRLITSPHNRGLGNNLNKGQDAVTGRYTLYIQEDFIPQALFKTELEKSVQIMNTNPDIDIIRFFSFFPYPFRKKYDNDFSEMVFKNSWLKWHHLKFYLYSDNPHLRRSNFFEKFGRYVENKSGDVTELRMCLSFLKNGAKGLFHDQHTKIFEHVNSSDEPSTADRVHWKQRHNIFIHYLRKVYLIYRFIKNSFQLAVFKNRSVNFK